MCMASNANWYLTVYDNTISNTNPWCDVVHNKTPSITNLIFDQIGNYSQVANYFTHGPHLEQYYFDPSSIEPPYEDEKILCV